MFRFVLSWRWLGFAVVVLALSLLFVRLGIWQFHRLDERHRSNAVVEHNLAAEPVDVTALLSPGAPVPDDLQWRRVFVTGTFDAARQVLLKYQTRSGEPGVDVITPLMTGTGTAVLVDRGWLATANSGQVHPDVPAPPAGPTTVSGWLMADQSGSANEVAVDDGSVRLVSSVGISPELPYPIYDGYVSMTAARPPSASPLRAPDPPELNSGPHLFYGLQWFFFAALAVFGWFYFAWTEAVARRRPARADHARPPAIRHS